MLTWPEKVFFVLLAIASLTLAYKGFAELYRIVRRGNEGAIPRTNDITQRIISAVKRTITQETVFKARPVASLFHSFIFYGFVYYLLVNVVDALMGLIPPAWFGSFSLGIVGDLFRLSADLLSVFILIGMVFFLVRRFIAKSPQTQHGPQVHLHESVKQGGIRLDSLIVGVFILTHVGMRLLGESFLLASSGKLDWWQPAASTLASVWGFGDGRIIGWHIGWWGAIGLILVFLPYFPRSKHLHLMAAPMKFVFDRRTPDMQPMSTGVLAPIDFEDETIEQFGAAKIEDLSFAQVLDSYACIQCNRCADVCPANVTGKALSPAALEINKRYELNQIHTTFAEGEESPRTLVEFALPEEAIWACTTCGACMEVCPVGCEQMLDIVDMRRDLVMMQGEFPAELQTAFRGMERTGNPWGISPDKRTEWAEGLHVPTVEENPDFEVLFWVGCAGSYDPAAQQTTRSMARILEHAGVNYAIIGKGERCTGDAARRAGNEYLYFQLAMENVETLNSILSEPLTGEAIERDLDPSKRKLVVTTCPHCFNVLFNDYPQLGGEYNVVHHTQFIDRLQKEGRLPAFVSEQSITFHDPCYLGRHNGEYDAPRDLLESGGGTLIEMERNKSNSFCCGAGGAQFWKEEEAGDMRVSDNRYQEAQATGADVIATGCPFCKVMLDSSAAEDGGNGLQGPTVRDIAQLVAEQLPASGND